MIRTNIVMAMISNVFMDLERGTGASGLLMDFSSLRNVNKTK